MARLIIHPPKTPPYLLLAFTSLQSVSAAIHAWNRSPRLASYVVELVGMVVILAIGVTYPLQEIYVGGNVAPVGNVSDFLVDLPLLYLTVSV